MDHHHPALRLRLPVELLSLVFDTLSLEQLLTSSHVSRYWRDVALRHPTFWRDIKLAALSTSALDFFHFRLDASTNRALSVHIYLPKVTSPARLRSVVLPAVTRNLHRCHGLFLEIDIAYDVDVFNALHRPAPFLNTLDIYMVHDTQTSSELPLGLFADEAPTLRHLQLINVQLCADRIPMVFSTIVDFRYGFDADKQSFPIAVFSHCPALQSLTICGRHCAVSLDEDQPFPPRSAEKLKFLDLAIFSGIFPLMQHVPCASIPHISISLHDLRSAHILLGHLQGSLELGVHAGTELSFHYKSLSTDTKRAFTGLLEQVVLGSLPSIYVSDDLLSRVQSAIVSSNCSNILPVFHSLPSCTTIAVTVIGGQLQPPPRPIHVPQLERIRISSSLGASIGVSELMTFVDAAFAPVSRPVSVALQGITLDGDLEEIPSTRFVVSRNAVPRLT